MNRIKASKIAFGVFIATIGVNIIFELNKTYDGMSLIQFPESSINIHTKIRYFQVLELGWRNIFYGIYVIYLVLLGIKAINIDFWGQND